MNSLFLMFGNQLNFFLQERAVRETAGRNFKAYFHNWGKKQKKGWEDRSVGFFGKVQSPPSFLPTLTLRNTFSSTNCFCNITALHVLLPRYGNNVCYWVKIAPPLLPAGVGSETSKTNSFIGWNHSSILIKMVF